MKEYNLKSSKNDINNLIDYINYTWNKHYKYNDEINYIFETTIIMFCFKKNNFQYSFTRKQLNIYLRIKKIKSII